MPRLYPCVRMLAERKQKAEHWGQVIPLEDAQRIMGLQSTIVRIPCVCRRMLTGREVRTCFAVGADPSLAVLHDLPVSLPVRGDPLLGFLAQVDHRAPRVLRVWRVPRRVREPGDHLAAAHRVRWSIVAEGRWGL